MQHAQLGQTPTDANVRELSDEDVEKFVREHELVAIEVYAQWCTFCRALEPHYADLADEYAGRMTFARIDGDFNPRYLQENDVQSYPTIHFYRGRERIGTIVGFLRPAELRSIFDEVGGDHGPLDGELEPADDGHAPANASRQSIAPARGPGAGTPDLPPAAAST